MHCILTFSSKPTLPNTIFNRVPQGTLFFVYLAMLLTHLFTHKLQSTACNLKQQQTNNKLAQIGTLNLLKKDGDLTDGGWI
ncbi:hypothetical protein TUM4630_01480 [Shewanella algidipiscicola]|uniref:Uncharacterized protein n=1 Tax=Shewanella algidipiscicola TaxID=614070 RepID=A0ABQ4P2Z4_9GAMM|nr:hypothetical protein TUM4630_01480 [Shewanella algidipiscicola]